MLSLIFILNATCINNLRSFINDHDHLLSNILTNRLKQRSYGTYITLHRTVDIIASLLQYSDDPKNNEIIDKFLLIFNKKSSYRIHEEDLDHYFQEYLNRNYFSNLPKNVKDISQKILAAFHFEISPQPELIELASNPIQGTLNLLYKLFNDFLILDEDLLVVADDLSPLLKRTGAISERFSDFIRRGPPFETLNSVDIFINDLLPPMQKLIDFATFLLELPTTH